MGTPSATRAFVLVQKDFFGWPACQPSTKMSPWPKSGTNPWTISALHFGHCILSLLIFDDQTLPSNVADRRRRARNAQNEIEASSRRSVHLHCWVHRHSA